jgi:hypothetical protein
MITLEKILTELKGESLNEIVGGTGCYNPPTCRTTTTNNCSSSKSKGKKCRPKKRKRCKR